MPTRNVNLTGQLDAFVETAVSGGQYQNASEVVREGLRLLQRRDEAETKRLEAFLAAVDMAEAQVARGQVIEIGDDIEGFIHAIGEEVRARRTERR